MQMIARAAAVIALTAMLALPAHGQGFDWPSYYKSLTIPDPRHPGDFIDCCDVAHCHPADAVFENGSWVAMSHRGMWVTIPQDRVSQNKFSAVPNKAILCESEPAKTDHHVYCFFREPNTT